MATASQKRQPGRFGLDYGQAAAQKRVVNRTGRGRHRGTGWTSQDSRSEDMRRNVLEARGEVMRPQGSRLRPVIELRRCHPLEICRDRSSGGIMPTE